jgi:hypothetical protein
VSPSWIVIPATLWLGCSHAPLAPEKCPSSPPPPTCACTKAGPGVQDTAILDATEGQLVNGHVLLMYQGFTTHGTDPVLFNVRGSAPLIEEDFDVVPSPGGFKHHGFSHVRVTITAHELHRMLAAAKTIFTRACVGGDPRRADWSFTVAMSDGMNKVTEGHEFYVSACNADAMTELYDRLARALDDDDYVGRGAICRQPEQIWGKFDCFDPKHP